MSPHTGRGTVQEPSPPPGASAGPLAGIGARRPCWRHLFCRGRARQVLCSHPPCPRGSRGSGGEAPSALPAAGLPRRRELCPSPGRDPGRPGPQDAKASACFAGGGGRSGRPPEGEGHPVLRRTRARAHQTPSGCDGMGKAKVFVRIHSRCRVKDAGNGRKRELPGGGGGGSLQKARAVRSASASLRDRSLRRLSRPRGRPPGSR